MSDLVTTGSDWLMQWKKDRMATRMERLVDHSDFAHTQLVQIRDNLTALEVAAIVTLEELMQEAAQHGQLTPEMRQELHHYLQIFLNTCQAIGDRCGQEIHNSFA